MYIRKQMIPGHVFGEKDDEDYKFIFKYIVIGDMSVGKSCLIHRFTSKMFHTNGVPSTLGLAFSTQTVEVANQKIKIHLWDTAGHERFRAVTRSHYRGAVGALLVYDITNRTTFDSLSGWLDDIELYSNADPVIFLIGNKSDLRNEREVTYNEASEFAAKHGLMFAETSAKNGSYVDDCFYEMARSVYHKMQQYRSLVLLEDCIKLSEDAPKKKSKWRC